MARVFFRGIRDVSGKGCLKVNFGGCLNTGRLEKSRKYLRRD